MHDKVLVWFRRDLRLNDHTALSEAMRQSRAIIPVFILNRTLIERESFGAALLYYFFESLGQLSSEISRIGGKLIIRDGDFTEQLVRLVKQSGADAVFYNRDYEPTSIKRDAAVERALASIGCRAYSFKDQVLLEESEILTGSGSPYKVFTPFSKKWKEKSDEIPLPFSKPAKLPVSKSDLDLDSVPVPSLSDFGKSLAGIQLLVEPGERAAEEQTRRFTDKDIHRYHEKRDFPAVHGTSQLSAALRAGCISPRYLYHAARTRSGSGNDDGDVDTFVNEIIWRDFYHYILFHFPHVAEGDFREEYRTLKWRDDSADLDAWSKGQTGYPIVDAGMRQLNRHGWMHNRLRMITASFLTKHLLLYWKTGERYFASHLVDFDLASNNGGWQWSASTGTDAQPYFRIFNPITQGKKFDANGSFIRAMCPELERVPTKYLFAPWEMPASVQSATGCKIGVDYPAPVVDHAAARTRALEAFQQARES